MQVYKMEVSKTETVAGKSSYVKVGDVDVYYPTLEECAGFVQDAKIEKVGEDGVAEYASAEANWIMTAILSYAKANARNKLVSRSTELKDGLTIPSTWAEFTAETGRSGEALAIMGKLKQTLQNGLASKASPKPLPRHSLSCLTIALHWKCKALLTRLRCRLMWKPSQNNCLRNVLAACKSPLRTCWKLAKLSALTWNKPLLA